MKKLKSILFKMKLDGRGIVNYDENRQKFALKEKNINHLYDHNDNVQYAKKQFFKNENGEWDYRIKISDGCLRNGIFRHDYPAHLPHLAKYPNLYVPYVASPATLLRGFLLTEKGGETTNRKGPLCVVSAKQTNDEESYLEIRTKSGERVIREEKGDVKDTSLFKKENISEITYQSEGFLDLKELQFISADQAYGRYNLNPDYFEMFVEELNRNLPDTTNHELKYYSLKDGALKYPELGLLLSEDNIKFLMVETIKRLLDLKINRSYAYAILDTLEIKLVFDPIKDKLNTENGWIKIESVEEFENLISDKQIETYYEESDYEESLALKKELKRRVDEGIQKRRLENEEKKKKKDKKKEESKNKEV